MDEGVWQITVHGVSKEPDVTEWLDHHHHQVRISGPRRKPQLEDWNRWWTGKAGVLQSMGRKESDTAEQLNWAEVSAASQHRKEISYVAEICQVGRYDKDLKLFNETLEGLQFRIKDYIPRQRAPFGTDKRNTKIVLTQQSIKESLHK